jgi:signal transduction histidine kinase/CheY-like chemotaxis protein
LVAANKRTGARREARVLGPGPTGTKGVGTIPSNSDVAGKAHAVLGELLIGAHSLAAVGPEVLECLAGVFGWALAELWLDHHDHSSLRCEASWVSASLPEDAVAAFGATARFQPGSGFPGMVWEARRPVISEDVTRDPGFVRKNSARILGLAGGVAFPVLLPGGEVVGVITTFSETPEGTATDPELLLDLGRRLGDFVARTRREAAQRSARVMEVYGRLSATLAEELNNALCVVLTGLGHLREEAPGDASLEEALAAAGRAAEVSRRLLLDTAPPLDHEEFVSLPGLIRSSIRDLEELLGPRSTLDVHLDDETPRVRGDPASVDQVLRCLVANAGEAIDDHGHVVIRCQGVGGGSDRVGQVLLSVSDDGPGMDEVSRAQAVDPLYSTRGRAGLGLTRVYSVVTQLGGTVELRSRAGEGCTVEVRLPAVHGRASTPPRPAVDPASMDAPSWPDTVLLVEDSRALRRQLRRVLEAAGVQVLDAASAEEALEVCREAGAVPSLLLSDVGLPGRSGVDLARELREGNPSLRVLFISGYPEEVLTERLRGCAYDSFLQKPFDAEVLLEELREVMGLPRSSEAGTST